MLSIQTRGKAGGGAPVWEWAGHRLVGGEQLFFFHLHLLSFLGFISLCYFCFHYYYYYYYY